MSKYEDAIIRYEDARQLVAKLDSKRKTLISECEAVDTCEDNHNKIVSFGENCFTRSWAKLEEINKESGFYDGVTFEDVFVEGIGMEDDPVCDNCLEAYRIKHHELAAARKEFGNAKRSLSKYGRMLIQERTHTVKD